MDKEKFIESVSEESGVEAYECKRVIDSVGSVLGNQIKKTYQENKPMFIAAGLLIGAKLLFGRRR